MPAFLYAILAPLRRAAAARVTLLGAAALGLALALWMAPGAARGQRAPRPPHVVFVAPTPAAMAAAEECAAVWRAEGAGLTAALLTAGAEADTVHCLVLDTGAFRQRFAGRAPDWGVGLAAPGGRLVALDYERLPAVGRGLREIFLHEMVHALLFQAAGGAWLPTWLHEGAAMQHAGEWRFSDTVSLALEGRVPDLAQLQGRFPAGPVGAGRAYRTSLLAVQRLQERHGPGVVGELAAAAARLGTFEAAFPAVTGESVDGFSADFAAAMQLRYGWLVMLTRWPTLFVLLGVVLILGAVRKLVVGRRRLAAMDEEPFA